MSSDGSRARPVTRSAKFGRESSRCAFATSNCSFSGVVEDVVAGETYARRSGAHGPHQPGEVARRVHWRGLWTAKYALK